MQFLHNSLKPTPTHKKKQLNYIPPKGRWTLKTVGPVAAGKIETAKPGGMGTDFCRLNSIRFQLAISGTDRDGNPLAFICPYLRDNLNGVNP